MSNFSAASHGCCCYNDCCGQVAGDECLRRVAAALKGCSRRPADMLSRCGGEEFACLLHDTDLSGATAVAQHMELELRALQLAHARSDVSLLVTLSIGVAVTLPNAGGEAAALV